MIRLTTYERNGGPLDNGPVDQNWLDIEDALNKVTAGLEVESSEIDANGALIIRFTNGTTIGPWAAPAPRFRHEGEWASGTAYDVNDIVTYEGSSYIVAELHQAAVFAFDLAAGKLGLLASAGASGDADPFADWPEDDDVVYAIRNRQRVAIDLSGGGGGSGVSSVTWDFMPPREAYDGDIVGFFRPPVAMRYSYVLPISGLHSVKPDVDYDLEVRRYQTRALVTTFRSAGGTAGEIGVPDFAEIAKDELLIVVASVPGSAVPFQIDSGLSLIFSKVQDPA